VFKIIGSVVRMPLQAVRESDDTSTDIGGWGRTGESALSTCQCSDPKKVITHVQSEGSN